MGALQVVVRRDGQIVHSYQPHLRAVPRHPPCPICGVTPLPLCAERCSSAGKHAAGHRSLSAGTFESSYEPRVRRSNLHTHRAGGMWSPLSAPQTRKGRQGPDSTWHHQHVV